MAAARPVMPVAMDPGTFTASSALLLVVSTSIAQDQLPALPKPSLPDSLGTCGGNTCMVAHDPQFMTFDCVRYEYHGKCDYTLVKTCADIGIQFEVIGHLRRLHFHPDMSVVKALEIRIKNTVIILDDSFGVTINGTSAPSVHSINLGSLGSIARYSNAVEVWIFGLHITWTSPFRAIFVVDPDEPQMVGALCGLCGTNNYNQSDDLTLGNGQLVTTVSDFGDSWHTNPGCGPCRDCDNTICVYNGKPFPAKQFCDVFTDGALPQCTDGGDSRTEYHQQCLDNICSASDVYFERDFCLHVANIIINCETKTQIDEAFRIGVCGLCNRNENFVCYIIAQCIRKERRCDGYQDCIDNSDELNCQSREDEVRLKRNHDPRQRKHGCSNVFHECEAILEYKSSINRNPFLKERKNRNPVAGYKHIYQHIMGAANDKIADHKLFACAFVFPECPDETTGESRVPCRHLCRKVLAEVSDHYHEMDTSAWPARLVSTTKCDDLPESDDPNQKLCSMVFKEKPRKQ